MKQQANLLSQRRAFCQALAGAAAWVCPMVTCAGTAATAGPVRVGGTGTGLGALHLLAQAFQQQAGTARFNVMPSLGSGGGLKALLAGAIDLAISSRPLNELESKAGAVAVELGVTPLAFVVPSASPVLGVSVQELTRYYAGKSDTWPDGSRLRLVMRPQGETDTQTLKSLGPELAAAVVAAGQRQGQLVAVTDQDAAGALETTPGALGALALSVVLAEKRALRALALNGMVPRAQASADGSYPLSKTLLLVTGPRSPREAHQLVQFARSAAARGLLESSGIWVR